MKPLVIFFFHAILTFIKCQKPGGIKAVMAENAIIRQQLILVQRKKKKIKSPPLTPVQRFLFGLCSFLLDGNRLKKMSVIISPKTILKFQGYLKKKKYSLLFSSAKSRKKPGPKGPSEEIITAVLEMKSRNPRMGCPKIAEFTSHTFGVEINKDVVRRILAKHHEFSRGNDGPSWLTFVGHIKDSLWSIDLFRVESLSLKSHWVMVVMDQYTRRIIGFSSVAGNSVNGQSVCRMFNKIIFSMALPKHLSSDNDSLFEYHQWKANLWTLEIDELKTIPYVPISHPFVERLIGTIRREHLDHIMFFGSSDLDLKLNDFKKYFNEIRPHSSLNTIPEEMGATDDPTKIVDLNKYLWKKYCRGLFQTPIAA